MNQPKIDCVKMKREIQQQIYEEIKDLSAQDQLDYFRKAKEGDTELAAKFRRISKAAPTVDELRRKPT